MRDYERLRKALESLVADPEKEGWDAVGGNSQGDYCVYCGSHYGVLGTRGSSKTADHDDDCPIAQGRAILADTAEASEMERLIAWLVKWEKRSRQTGHAGAITAAAIRDVLDYIKSEFLGGE